MVGCFFLYLVVFIVSYVVKVELYVFFVLLLEVIIYMFNIEIILYEE